MKKAAVGVLAMALLAGMAFSQTVNICGKVTDPAGNPLTNTLVRLGQTRFTDAYGSEPYYTVTDASGNYKLGTGTCTVPVINPAATMRTDVFSKPVYVGGQVLFSLPQDNLPVTIGLYNLTGQFVKELVNSRPVKGNYAVTIDTRGISSQFYVVRVSINGVTSVFKLQPFSRIIGSAVAQKSQQFQTKLEKLAAIVDTLRATEPGYTLGVKTIDALAGQYDFVLSKNNTWNGDTNAFWDTASAMKQAGHIWYTLLNRTGGQFPDSLIYWAIGDGGPVVCLKDSHHIDFSTQSSGRLYIHVGYKPAANNKRPQTQVWDFEEHTNGNGWFHGNTTRVDAYGCPIAYRLHATDGYDASRGEKYHVYFQTRQSFFDEYLNEVPKEFTKLGTMRAPYRIPNPGSSGSDVASGGIYASYSTAYCQANGVNQTPYLNGIASPQISAGAHRHVLGMTNAEQQDDRNYYKAAPCSFYSYFLHRRALANKCYGFPYDDYANGSSYLEHGNMSWVIIAIGY